METMNQIPSEKKVNPHVSVDCVLFGYDGGHLNVLLVQQNGEDSCRMKLPGSLIYEDEDLDEAAQRVLYELTGIDNIDLVQFKTFGSKDRTKNPKDTLWLERFHRLNTTIDRIVTVAYMSIIKIDKRKEQLSPMYNACWLPLDEVGALAFDHNQIIEYAHEQLIRYIEVNPAIIYSLLPHKFTILQIRHINECLYNKELDQRNFHKKIMRLKYVFALEEFEDDVKHRAARYYKFDRKTYNKEIHKIF